MNDAEYETQPPTSANGRSDADTGMARPIYAPSTAISDGRFFTVFKCTQMFTNLSINNYMFSRPIARNVLILSFVLSLWAVVGAL